MFVYKIFWLNRTRGSKDVKTLIPTTLLTLTIKGDKDKDKDKDKERENKTISRNQREVVIVIAKELVIIMTLLK